MVRRSTKPRLVKFKPGSKAFIFAGEDIARMLKSREKRPFAMSQFPTIYKTELSPAKIEIMEYAKRQGVRVENVLDYSPALETARIRRRGVALEWFPSLVPGGKMSRGLQEKIVDGIIEQVSKLHSIGIFHGHLHSGNIIFILPAEAVELADFKKAERKKDIKWRDPQKVFSFFKNDLRMLLRQLKPLGIDIISNEEFLERLISGYSKMTPVRKMRLLEIAKKGLARFLT